MSVKNAVRTKKIYKRNKFNQKKKEKQIKIYDDIYSYAGELVGNATDTTFAVEQVRC